MKPAALLMPLATVLFLIFMSTGHCSAISDSQDPAAKAPLGRDAPWQPEAPGGKVAPPVITKLGHDVIKIGQVTVNKADRFVSVPGAVNMVEGLVEYLACGSRGKLHESILMLHVEPYHLQVALLLIGLKPGTRPLASQGAKGVPDGDPVELWVFWQTADRKEIRMRAEDLVYNIEEKKPMPRINWIFTGSEILDGRYMAQVEQSIIATYHDPFAMFDHPLHTGEDDTLYHVNPNTIPPKETPVTLVIKPVSAGRPQKAP